uniref:Uncharacterized protein n=1 Tax=Tanacetum cinerariifolium TaxID=118510 RepID=A0A699KDB0_TANCI|nr:hypothetical protein [Tanacetum cinerariifolium]
MLEKHDLEGYKFEKICNNDKSLSEIELEHEKEDEFVVVVAKMVHEYCMMVVKEIVSRILKEDERTWNGGLSKTLMLRKNKMKKVIVVIKKRLVEKEKKNWDEMIHHHFHQSWHQVEVMRKDDFEWRRRS